MKKVIIYFLFTFSLITSISCNLAKEKEENVTKEKDALNVTEVPAAVLTSFNAKYPDALEIE